MIAVIAETECNPRRKESIMPVPIAKDDCIQQESILVGSILHLFAMHFVVFRID